jgi:hypothetical protein
LTDDQGMGDMVTIQWHFYDYLTNWFKNSIILISQDTVGSDFAGLMPTIRKLNEAGLNFTQYYSASLCTPARSSLMTGSMSIFNFSRLISVNYQNRFFCQNLDILQMYWMSYILVDWLSVLSPRVSASEKLS